MILDTSTRAEKQSFGEAGAAYVNDTGPVTGVFCAVTSLDDATYFTTLTWENLGNNADGTAITNHEAITGSANTLPKGVTLFGKLTAVTLGAGRVVIYNATYHS